MKNINLVLSILFFLVSTGVAASSEVREEAPQPSWVRAVAVKTQQEIYDILSSATDHQITVPSLEECKNFINKVMHPVRIEETTPVDEISGKTISLQLLSEAINQVVEAFEKLARSRASWCLFPDAFICQVNDHKSVLFYELYKASTKILPEESVQ